MSEENKELIFFTILIIITSIGSFIAGYYYGVG